MRRLIDPAQQGSAFAARVGSGYDSQRDLKARAEKGARYETETERIVPARRSETFGPWYRGAISGTTTINGNDGFITGTNTTVLTTAVGQPVSRAGRVVGGRLMTDVAVTAGSIMLRVRVTDADGTTTTDTDIPDCALDTTTTRVVDFNLPYELGVPFQAGSSILARLVCTSLSPAVNLRVVLVAEYEEPVT